MHRRFFLAGGSALLTVSPAAAHIAPLPATPITLPDARNPFYGLVLAGRHGVPAQAQSVGLADIDARRPVTAATRFAIGSISKWLSAVAMLRLVDQGKLALEAPIRTYLPDFRADTGGRVTLRHLLCNASGIPNLFNQAVKDDPSLLDTPLTADQAISRFCQGDPIFAPMERFDYALTNWIILAGIVEKISGLPFDRAVAHLALDPLGLAGTSLHDDGAALSYWSVSPPQVRQSPRPAYLAASGGFYATGPDLLRAAHGVFGTPLLSNASRQALLTPQIDDYALGGRVKRLRVDGAERLFAWETGRTMGFRSLLAHRLDNGETLVLLNNTDQSQKALDELAFSLLAATKAG